MNRTRTILHDTSNQVDSDRKRRILQPIEAELAKTNQGFNLKARTIHQKTRESDLKKPFVPIEVLSPEQIESGQIHHGLISLFNSNSDHETVYVKPKVIVCVTMYNEARKELEETLDGIVSNIATFKDECNISNNEILVIVVYDGIDRMNASKDSDDSMLDYFTTWDQSAKIDQRRTMKQEYDDYCYMLKISKLDVEKIKENEFKEIKHDPKLENLYNKYSAENSNDRRSQDQLKSDFLYAEKLKAAEFIKSKVSNAYIYQMKHVLQKAQSGDESDTADILDGQDTLNILHCVKYQNGGKLSSHLWFFCGFCELFQPDYTILLDCGLIPDKRAIFNMFLAMETDPDIGGVCGFMGIKFQDIYTEGGERNDNYKEDDIDCISDMYQRVFDIQKAQQYEYNMGHFIDKPFESLFGYIQVLPGAFSGYRWEALKRDKDNESILDDYLSSVLDKDQELTLEQENMNLAEDRILCLKIFSKRGAKYSLRYLPNCKAVVDPVPNLIVLVSQRRRWINGSTFALRMCLHNRSIIYESDHTPFQIVLFKISMCFAWLNDSLSYISLSVFFTIIFIMLMTLVGSITLNGALNAESPLSIIFSNLFLAGYFLVLCMIIFYSLSFDTRSKHVIQTFYTISAYLGIMMLVAYCVMLSYIFLITVFTINTYVFGNNDGLFGTDGILQDWEEGFLKKTFCFLVVLGFFGNFIPYLFNFSRIPEMIRTFIHFIGYQSQYIHLLIIYAFCRIDDLSWGTKGSDVASSQKEVSKKIKFSFVTKWFLLNFVIGFVFGILLTSTLLSADDQYKFAKPIILVLLSVFFVGQLMLRIIGAVIYEIIFFFFRIKMINKGKAISNERKTDGINDKINSKTERFFMDKDNQQPKNQNILKNLS